MNTNNGNKAKVKQAANELKIYQFPQRTKVEERSNEDKPTTRPEVPTSKSSVPIREFESPVILEQSSNWSRAILWGLLSVTTITIVWASIARIEEAIPAQGNLEPTGAVKEIQAPLGGVVKTIYVKDGQKVKKGDRLISFDPTKSVSQLASLLKVRTAIIQENQFYQAQMGKGSSMSTQQAMTQLGLPEQLLSLLQSRSALTAENQLFKAQLGNQPQKVQLNGQQIDRLQSNQAELNSRVAAAQSEVEQLTRQLNQTQIQLASAKDTVAMNKEILQNIQPLAAQGAMSRIQYLKQQQELRTSVAEVGKLSQERERLKLEIDEARSKLQNTTALNRKDLLTQIANNDKGIAEIDSQLTKTMIENNKRLAEIDSQISEVQQNLRYEELTAPSNGTVFDLKPTTPGFVANSSEPILKIVPDDVLTAKVFITNKDIGFVKEGMNVDVRIDSFPFSEFGDVKGKLLWVGSDALPPDSIHPFYRFPAKISLGRQSLLINGRTVPLQSGMSVSGNIKVRDRTVMSIFTDLFTKNIDNLKSVR